MVPKVGILDFQGGVEEHLRSFQRLKANVRKIKYSQDILDLTHLVIPGGESTVIGRFLEPLKKQITEQYAKGKIALWGTCAGAILLGKKGSPYSLNLIDLEIERNAYGRQIDSFATSLSWTVSPEKIQAVFIRAPKITKTGPSVKILAKDENSPVLCRENKILVSTFHPELTESTTVHQYFLETFI